MPLWSILSNSYDWCKWSKACSEGFWVRIVRYRLSGIVDGTLALCSFWRIAFQRVNAIILSSRPISNPICHRLILSGCKPSPAEANPIRSFGPIFPVGYPFKSSSLPSFRCSFLNFFLTAYSPHFRFLIIVLCSLPRLIIGIFYRTVLLLNVMACYKEHNTIWLLLTRPIKRGSPRRLGEIAYFLAVIPFPASSQVSSSSGYFI